MWWFDVCIYCAMMAITSPVNISITSQSHWVLCCVCMCVCWEHLRFTFINFQVYNTVLLTVITMLYLWSPELTHLKTESLYPLTNTSPFPPSPSLWQPPIYSLFLILAFSLQKSDIYSIGLCLSYFI